MYEEIIMTQDIKFKEWKGKHNGGKCKHADVGAIGGKYTWEITPTGLGQIVKVKCNACNKILDLTEEDSW